MVSGVFEVVLCVIAYPLPSIVLLLCSLFQLMDADDWRHREDGSSTVMSIPPDESDVSSLSEVHYSDVLPVKFTAQGVIKWISYISDTIWAFSRHRSSFYTMVEDVFGMV